MYAPKKGKSASAALALTLALSVPHWASAQSGPVAEAPVQAGAQDAPAQSGVPLPEFIELAPLTAADVAATEKPPAPQRAERSEPQSGPAASATTPSQPAAAETASTTAPAEVTAAPAEAATQPQPSAPASAESRPAANPQPATTASVPTETGTRAADIESRVPMPEPANVPPPTAKDIGQMPVKAADALMSEKLKELFDGKIDRYVERKKEREAVEAFYKESSYAPVWFDNGKATKRLTAAVTRLRHADADGLDADDFATPDVKMLGEDPAALAQAELRMTNAVLTYAREAQSGRVTPSRISTNIEFTPPVPDPADVLQKVTTSENVAATLDAFNPQHDGFLALKRKLAELRGKPAEDDAKVVHIPSGATLRPGASDDRVPLLRERLGVTGEGRTYDAELVAAVKEFQKQKGVSADGLVGPRTVDMFNGTVRSTGRQIDTIVSNMERWRWLPRELGHAYVMVNIPDYTLRVVRNHKVSFHTRIVVGKPNTPSPSFAATIETIQVNPTWHVPQSIIYNEYLPALRQDPTVLARMGLVMEHNRDGSVSIRQPPGERNALGRIKFNFPNRFQVYLHDTPDKNLFNHDRRAYSHGCMRVQNPTMFGEALAAIALPGDGFTSSRFQSMFGSGERWIKFQNKIPVYLTYMNAYVDEAGKLVVRPDIYGYDGRVQSAIRGQYVQVQERSQRVDASAMRRARQIVQEYPRQPPQQQQRGFFPFPWFQ
ncbi:MAG: L,D-transpeptidase family protein [Rhizobiales bacterium]|nr:L,D-transpeptidase family protein [Hyphomicrobiales bacterium]